MQDKLGKSIHKENESTIHKIFSHVRIVKHTSIRLFLPIETHLDEIEQLDVKMVLLHGELEERISMTQSEDFVSRGNENKIYGC